MLRRYLLGVAVAVMAGGLASRALAEPRASPCGAVGPHAEDTVIVFRPPSTFTICRDGSVEEDVVTGRRVYLELEPTVGARMFDFRVQGQATEWTPTGLASWEVEVTKLSDALRDLEHAAEPISELAIPVEPPSPSPLRSLAAARERYLGQVTTRFRDALRTLRSDLHELPVIAEVARRWCGELGGEGAPAVAVGAELRARCTGPEVKDPAVAHQVEAFEAAARKFTVARDRAREAAVAAISRADDAAGVVDGARALDDARRAATDLVPLAHTLRDSSVALGRDIAVLRAAFRSIGTLRPGLATYLTTYATSGNAELTIDAIPADIAATGHALTQRNSGKTTARYSVVGHHFVDVEAGVGFTAGLPNIPYTSSVANVTTLQSKPVDEFVGLALVELEPLRFLRPDHATSGLLRLPVLGVPFTRDPTQNFFIGGGVGWTGVGSVIAGPYLLRERTLRGGFSDGEALPAGTSFEGATVPALQVGYFVSASLDLLGLFHAFFPGHGAQIDGASGREM